MQPTPVSQLEMTLAIVSVAASIFATLAVIAMGIYAIIVDSSREQEKQKQERLHQ